MKNFSTRGRITLLMLSLGLPAIGLTIFNALRERASAEMDARENVKRIADLAARQQAQIVEGAKQTLLAISQLPPALLHNPKACGDYLARIQGLNEGFYHAMGFYQPDGELICDSLPWEGRVSGGQRSHFQLAVSSGRFSIGVYQVGRLTGRQGLNFAYPVLDETGKLVAVAFIAVNLESFNRIAAATPLPEGAVLGVLDAHATVLARVPERTEAIGQKIRVAPLREAVLARPEGLIEALGADGRPRLYAYQTVARNPDGAIALRVIVGVKRDLIFADANRGLAHTLAGLLSATVLLLAATWYLAERLVLRSIRKLVDTAHRVRAGDLSARTRFHYRGDELSHVGMAIDQMAQALQEREAELATAMRVLREQSITDPLTGLYNRRYLLDLLPREVQRARRNGTRLAVIMVDVDHFKRINDSFGHQAGDLVLRALGALLKERIRATDTACRYGGEEFLLVLPEAALEGARRRAEAIREAVQALRLAKLEQPLGPITASLGVAVFPDHARDGDSLLRLADESLYEAKTAGRNRVVVSASSAIPPEL
jgi:diguanylate cyclase (GGDEF)-like protein